MGRLSDHLLAHTGPRAGFGPSDLPVSLREHAPPRASGAKLFLTSREHGFIALEAAGLDGTWHPSCSLTVEQRPSGGVPSSLSGHVSWPSVAADKPPRDSFWAPPLPNAEHLRYHFTPI